MTEARQLDIFKSKRQRGVKPRGATEFEIHCAVADYLRHGLAKGWMWWHTPNGEYRMKSTAGRLKRMGVKVGVSDILLFNGQLHALELKRQGEALSHQQLLWQNDVKALGGKVDCADNVDDALRILAGWGAISTRIHLEDG